MKLKNVEVGMKVFVKDKEGGQAESNFIGKIVTILETDRNLKQHGAFEIKVVDDDGCTDVMDACDVRKVKESDYANTSTN